MSVPDTPDYQHGVVAPQQLLGTLAGGGSGTFGLPANCEALLIVAPTGGGDALDSVVGGFSGTYYPFTALPVPPGSGGSPVYVCLVVPALDDTVTITTSGGGDTWYVVADSAPRAQGAVTPPGAYALSNAFGNLDLFLPYPGPDLNTLSLTASSYQPAYDAADPGPPQFVITAPLIPFAAGTIISPDTGCTLQGLSATTTNGTTLHMAVFVFDTAAMNAIYILGEVDIPPPGTAGSLTMADCLRQQVVGGDLSFTDGEGSLSSAGGGLYSCVLMVWGTID